MTVKVDSEILLKKSACFQGVYLHSEENKTLRNRHELVNIL